MEKRWAEVSQMWQGNQFLYVITGFLIGILFFPAIESFSNNASEVLSTFVPEATGIGFTVLLIERLNRNRELRREEERLKRDLIRQLGSRVNSETIRAAQYLREYGWLSDGSLQKARLVYADLCRTYLRHADLRYADMRFANLKAAQLGVSDLRGANLLEANLENTKLVNFELGSCICDEETILPDGTNWTNDTDMNRFTDRTHPNFWRSSKPRSPAYEGDDIDGRWI